MFIADCIFYWMLYVSPFDAANRLIKRMFRARRTDNHAANEQVVDDVGAEVHPHQHQQQVGGGDRGWHFNIHWSSHDH